MTPARILFPKGAYPRVGHSAVLARDGQTVFYFGGMNAESEEREMGNDHGGFANATMSDILLFNTANQSWSRRMSIGDVLPSPRAFHTTTQSMHSFFPIFASLLICCGSTQYGRHPFVRW